MKFSAALGFILFPVFLTDAEYTFETRYIDVPLDHFSFITNQTFALKYLVNDSFFVDNGPIFFYTGNEGDINMFAQNSGFIFDIAPDFKALIVFAEHRYYGESLPFGNLSYTSPEYLGYLSTMQALADYVYLINNLQNTYQNSSDNLTQLPVIAFGGSYGGMLAAWQKMKYPNSILGAIASSAPIWAFKNQNPCDSFYKIITEDFKNTRRQNCVNAINASWVVLREFTNNETGKSELADMWNFCDDFETDDDIDNLIEWLTEIYAALAETNYPLPNRFLGTFARQSPLKNFIYTNYTGTTECNSLESTSEQLGEEGWNFQACTEMIMPMCSKDTDMFENTEWEFDVYSDFCYKTFGVRPWNEDVPILLYGDKDLSSAHNIIFTNGLLDPWSGYGVLTNYSSDVIALIIEEGAHHSELRAAHENDPMSVIGTRAIIKDRIYNWINEYNSGAGRVSEILYLPLLGMFYNIFNNVL
ncbi:hypothetical protein NQ317_006172 [Molorchus minor]|uniref:Lysosomal Pro-X carboxypeptidase n=1 Tax=Molorchus minor TaxID=1323400 RepID=A0ABQ9JG38_9CUCU|nr:hypothetical protein NQ317_006172 [Molorchus minor]